MRPTPRAMLLAGLLVLTPMLTACENFDMDKLDVFGLNAEKKLPGARKPLFPEGVPGVSQGIPPEYMKGAHQQPAESSLTPPATPLPGTTDNAAATSRTAAVAPAEEVKPPPAARPKTASKPRSKPKPKPKPKPKTASAPPPPPPQQPAARRQQQQSDWPAPSQSGGQNQSDWPDPGQQQSPWPAAPSR